MSARIQKLTALLKRVEERRAQPRLLAVAAPVAAPASAHTTQDSDLFAATIPPEAPTIAPPASLPPAVAAAPSMRPDPSVESPRRIPSMSPLEDAMAHLGATEDSGPLHVQPLATPIHTIERRSLPDPHINQDLVLTHRPEAGPAQTGPIVELVQPKAPGPREPTIQFDTGVKANPLTQRDLKPVGLVEPPAESPPAGPTQKLVPQPLPAHAPPARVVSEARHEAVKTFGELLDLSLALRPTPR
jgi:hypothetical protein